MKRRAFLKTAASAGLGGIGIAQQTSAADAEVEVRPGEPGPVINPHIYGHFIEHLGGVIYDGIWVGPDSKIPNIDGIRKQFVDDMKRIGAPNLRWPGGCFADGYHWRDGIGPRDERPRTYNRWQTRMPEGVDATETNHFGTHEFMRLCQLVDAEPYIAANVGSSTPAEFRDWILYCNAPAGTVTPAIERGRNGHPEPFHVRYWGVGNEAWGCGGNFKPEEYAVEYRKFSTQYPTAYLQPYLIAVGPSGGRPDGHIGWTRGYFEAMQGHVRAMPRGWALHYYTRPRLTPKAARDSRDRWYDILQAGARMERLIEEHWRVMGEFDKQHVTKFVIDEWGVWQPPGAEIGPQYILSQVGSLRDALHAALTFDIFNRHADKIDMAQIAQSINCLHSLFAASGDRFIRTPTYYVFEMYRPHMGARRVPVQIRAQELNVSLGGEPVPLFGLAGSASVNNQQVTVTLVNPSLDADVNARVRVSGARVREARGQVLTHGDMAAANSFESPDRVKPASLPVSEAGGEARVRVPKQAVAALQLRLV